MKFSIPTNIRHLFLTGLLVAHAGCPMTCIVNPFEDDYLTTDMTVTINGELLDYENFELQGVVSNTEMPCTTTYYRENYGDYENDGATSSSCETTSEWNGFFSLDLSFEGPGLYKFNFDFPPIVSEGRLITVRPDLEAAPDQYVHINWKSDGAIVTESLVQLFMDTLDGVTERMASVYAELTKIETERYVESMYDSFRVYLIDELTPDMDVQMMAMQACPAVEDGGCFGGGFLVPEAGCMTDYGNANLTGGGDSNSFNPCYLWVPSYLRYFAYYFFEAEDGPTAQYITLNDGFERIKDVGHMLGRATAHELGHALGLVDRFHLFGKWSNPGRNHNPPDPAFLGSRRFLPMALMGGPLAARHMELIEDCNPVRRGDRDPGEPIVRCPHRWNVFNRQYLEIVQ